MSKVAVLGAGGWGIALSLAAYNNGNKVSLWSPFENEVEELSVKRHNNKLLNGIKIPEKINVTSDINCVKGTDIIIIAVPSVAVRETVIRLKEIKKTGIIVTASKGLEKGTLKRLSEIVAEELPENPVVVLSGPSHAEEVSRNIPTSLVAASINREAAEKVQEIMMSSRLRIYTNDDIIGVELGGAFKNIIAVAAGFCDGLKLGDNTKAALITRGLYEIADLGKSLGARQETFMGLTGLGDLVVTCTSTHSRNHNFGELMGKGENVETALKLIGTVEGYYAVINAYNLAKKQGIEVPIIEEVYKALYENSAPGEAVDNLMTRPGRAENETIWS